MLKTLLVTGANGFVGKSLTERFKDKYNLIALKSTNLNLLELNDVKSFFEKNKIDLVFHCANQGGSRVTGYDAAHDDVTLNNLKMFFNLERFADKNTRLIAYGSGAQYNKKRDLINVREDEIGAVIPDDAYGFSKFVQHKYIEKTDNIIYPIIFGLFGKYEDYKFKFISNAIVKNLLKLPIVINQNVVFDFLYIEDFLNIMELLITNKYELKSFNISSGSSIDLISICKIVNDISDYKSEIIIKNDGLNFQYTADNTFMLSQIGDYKFMTYRESISHLYKYFQSVIEDVDYNEIASDEYIKYCKVNK